MKSNFKWADDWWFRGLNAASEEHYLGDLLRSAAATAKAITTQTSNDTVCARNNGTKPECAYKWARSWEGHGECWSVHVWKLTCGKHKWQMLILPAVFYRSTALSNESSHRTKGSSLKYDYLIVFTALFRATLRGWLIYTTSYVHCFAHMVIYTNFAYKY